MIDCSAVIVTDKLYQEHIQNILQCIVMLVLNFQVFLLLCDIWWKHRVWSSFQMAERKKKDNPHRFGAHLHKDKKSVANDRNRTTTVAKTAKVSRPIAIITSMCHLYYMQKKWNQKQNFCVSLWEVVFTKWYVIVLNEWIASLMGLGLSTATIYYKASVLCCHFHCTIFFVIWNLSNWPEYRKKIDNREWEMEVQASKCAIIVHICVWEKRVPFYHWFICIAGNFTLVVCAPSKQQYI